MNAEALLRLIAGAEQDGFFELRWSLPGVKGMGREFHPLSDPVRAARAATRRGARTDLYVGAAPRTRRQGDRAAVPRSWCLWVDCDNATSAAALARFPHPPSALVASGSGRNRHAWWALSEPLAADYTERANRRLTHALGADPACADVTRILRLPGTFNHKAERRAPVVAIGTGLVYDVRELVGSLPDPVPRAKAQQAARAPRRSGSDRLRGLSSEHYYSVIGRRQVSNGLVQCPFHKGGQERTPSMQLYETTWACFGCEPPAGQRFMGGGIYEFAAMAWGFSWRPRGREFLELKARLAQEMGVSG